MRRLFVLLLLVTAVAYAPAWRGQPVWDDAGHLTRPDLQSIDGLRRIWTDLGATQQYYPVVHTAFWVQHQLWGDDTLGYHLVNIALHATSAWLVALLLVRLGVRGAWLAALVFALHPVHVESVAWMAELKNTLSGAFVLAAAWWYLRFDETRVLRHYLLAAVLFALALLSKSVTAPLPFVLLVVIWWKRGGVTWREDVRPLVPLVVLAVAAGVTTVLVERWLIGAQGDGFGFSAIERVLIAGRASWFYLGSLAWPVSLSFNYSRWAIDVTAWWQYLYPAGMAALLGGLWWGRDRWGRGPLAGLAVFLLMAAPALGFVDAYPFRFSFVADHFQYLASIGAIAAAAAGLTTLAERWTASPRVRQAGVVLVCLPLACLTWAQSGHYTDEETLYRATLIRNPASWLAHTNLSALLVTRSPAAARPALEHARAAARLQPRSPAVQYNLGLALEATGAFAEAASHYREAIELFDPGGAGGRHYRLSHAHHRLGVALASSGRLEEAVGAYRQALIHAPADPDVHTDLAMTLARQRDFAGALSHFESAARVRPDSAAYNNLGGVALQAGRLDDAVHWLEQATHLDPDFTDAFFNLGTAFMQLGRWTDAASAYERVLQTSGPSPDLLARLGGLFFEAGDIDRALRYFQDVLRLDPSHQGASAAVRELAPRARSGRRGGGGV